MWLTRNGILHETDNQGMNLARSQHVTTKITEAFATNPMDLLPGDRGLLTTKTLEGVLRLPPSEKEVWLHAYELAKEFAQEDRNNELQGMCSVWENWLAWNHPT